MADQSRGSGVVTRPEGARNRLGLVTRLDRAPMSDPGGTMREGEIDVLPLSMPPALRSPLRVQDRASRETINTATKEACAGVIHFSFH